MSFVPRILFTFASRNRPERFFKALLNLIEMCSDKDHYTVFACLDEDDPYIDGYNTMAESYGDLLKHVIFDYGYSKSKIDAINRKWPDSIDYDIIINWSDDMNALVFGFDVLIKQYFYSVFPEGDGLLHMSDQDAKAAVPVLYIADKKYYNRDGFIYHPSYLSLWCDNESMEVAKLRERYHFCGEVVFHHLNPAYGHQERDTMFDIQQGHWGVDEANYHARKAINFGL
jgi:hypothetical protein